jgi:hypothetical protein
VVAISSRASFFELGDSITSLLTNPAKSKLRTIDIAM